MMEFLIASISKVIEVPLDEAFGYFLCTLAGVAASWVWKCKREGIKFSSYWLEDIWNMVLVFLGAVAAFLMTIIIEPGVGKATYLAIGIAADSMVGKPPLPAQVKLALSRIQQAQNESSTDVNVSDGDGLRLPEDVRAIAADAIAKTAKNYVNGVPSGKADS